MSDDEWKEWTVHHRTLFGMREPDDVAMVGLWRALFPSITRDELIEASNELAKQGAPYRSNHPSALLRILSLKRGEMYRRRQADFANEGQVDCGICRGQGYVTVPHPACILDGEFLAGPAGYKAAAMVTCSCGIGRYKQSTFDAQVSAGKCQRPMELMFYETRFTPRWKAMLDEWEEEKRAVVRASEHGGYLDRSLGKLTPAGIVKRIATATALPK